MKKQNIILKWLDNEYGNLTEVVRNNEIFYVNQDGLPLFVYYRHEKNEPVYIKYEKIWQLLETIFDMDYQQIQDILKIWLEKTYKIMGYTPITNELTFWCRGWNKFII